MEHCCDSKTNELEVLWARQSRILWAVLAINAGMFVVEAAAGLVAGSAALLGDSLDMLGDALVYGVSLAVIGRSQRARAGAAAMKGTAMLLFGVAVLAEVAYKLYTQRIPDAALMSVTAAAALAANSICLVLLTRHRSDDLNMRSAWICSRNDLAANVGVLLAAAGVYLTSTVWPDIIVGLLITGLFLRSSVHVLRQAASELRACATAGLPSSAERATRQSSAVRCLFVSDQPFSPQPQAADNWVPLLASPAVLPTCYLAVSIKNSAGKRESFGKWISAS